MRLVWRNTGFTPTKSDSVESDFGGVTQKSIWTVNYTFVHFWQPPSVCNLLVRLKKTVASVRAWVIPHLFFFCSVESPLNRSLEAKDKLLAHSYFPFCIIPLPKTFVSFGLDGSPAWSKANHLLEVWMLSYAPKNAENMFHEVPENPNDKKKYISNGQLFSLPLGAIHILHHHI